MARDGNEHIWTFEELNVITADIEHNVNHLKVRLQKLQDKIDKLDKQREVTNGN